MIHWKGVTNVCVLGPSCEPKGTFGRSEQRYMQKTYFNDLNEAFSQAAPFRLVAPPPSSSRGETLCYGLSPYITAATLSLSLSLWFVLTPFLLSLYGARAL
eukprot:Hpha_TRINITY_DN16445_c6_g1::TRINITY_DN16445_c6_g1_i1::g.159165::m.159165